MCFARLIVASDRLKAAGQRLMAARLQVNVLAGWLIKIFTLYLQKHIIDVI